MSQVQRCVAPISPVGLDEWLLNLLGHTACSWKATDVENVEVNDSHAENVTEEAKPLLYL